MFEVRAITSISILILAIFLGYFLKSIKLLQEDHSKVITKLILNITLPALIFTALSQSDYRFEKLMLALVMIISLVVSALLAYFVASLMRLSRAQKGGLILASSFPSSAFLGYAVVKQIYRNNQDVLTDAVTISELGVAIPLFTLGVFIAIHFGNTKKTNKEIRKEILHFLYSPIFFAIVLGLVFSFVNINNKNIFVAGFYDFLGMLSAANSFLVVMCIGLMLNFRHFKFYGYIILIAILIKLIIQPLLSYGQSILFDFNDTWQQISVLIASMPTAAMTAVFSKKYGDDPDLTSVLVLATFTSSCITMIMMLILLGFV